jgi:hypothetical protein
MTIDIGTCSDDRRALIKSPSLGNTITATVKEPCRLLQPTFIVEYNSSLIDCNYIRAFGRYYFINDMIMLVGHRMELVCSIDALYTYSEAIQRIQADIARQENLVEPYLPDENYIFLDTYDVIGVLPSTTYVEFYTYGDTDECYVLGVAGADNTHKGEVDGFTALTSEPSDYQTRFMFYYVNKGTTAYPNMIPIGTLITNGEVSSGDASSYAYMVSNYGTIYRNNNLP